MIIHEVDASLFIKFILSLILFVLALRSLRKRPIPSLTVAPPQVASQRTDGPQNGKVVPCYDPATREHLGEVPAMDKVEVESKIKAAKKAAEEWKHSSFQQRRLLLQILLKYITEHQTEICQVASRDSGKPILDAAFGEVLVTCEKICWLVKEGERWLKPEYRTSSRMAYSLPTGRSQNAFKQMFYKSARVEYQPIGVIGAIVPWNYPFHNLFNPLTSTLFAGNALVIKVSEHASWSAKYYGDIIQAALSAAGAPRDLVQIVTGYGEAGSALVQGGVGKVIFVGSTEVGRKVMAAASKTLTPVVLELGGKDPIIICSDADIDHACTVTLRGTYISGGQNCAGCERVLIHQNVYDKCLERLVRGATTLRQRAPLQGDPTAVDSGAIALPGLVEKIDSLVKDAVSHGAKVLVGGEITHPEGAKGDFYAPTVLSGVTPDMRIWKEEVFGPVMVVVSFKDDQEAIVLANDCAFGLGSNIFSRSLKRANAMARQLQAGMTTINDFATSYMNQSLPFGGVKESGFDRFAGVEGLRGVCHVKSICQDRWSWLIRTDIPPILQYPTKPAAFAFQTALVRMFYAPGLIPKLRGLLALLCALLQKSQ